MGDSVGTMKQSPTVRAAPYTCSPLKSCRPLLLAIKSCRLLSHKPKIAQGCAAILLRTRRLFEEWTDIGRARIERGFGRIEAFLQCRTPQDFAALQGELLRDNMETVVSYARKAREHSARLADEAERRFGSLAEVMTSRPGEVWGQGQTTQRRPSHRAARRKSVTKRSAAAAGATAKRRRPSH